MNTPKVGWMGVLLLGGIAFGQAQDDGLLKRAEVIKPRPEELKWQKIPWMLDLLDGQRVARAERRPIFLWVAAGAPMERGSGVPEGVRACPLSDDDVVRRLSTMFVPVAVNLWEVRGDRGPAGDLFRSVQKQVDQYQGFWIVSPEGKVLAAPMWKERAQAVPAMGQAIDEALKASGPLKPREVKATSPLPFRGIGARPDGSVTLAVCGRLLHRGQSDGPIMLDSVTLGAEEWARFTPPQPKSAAQEWSVPEDIARKLVVALAPMPRGLDFRPEGARKAQLKAKLVSVESGKARIALSGAWEAQGTREGVTYSGKATAEGIALCDVNKGSLRSLLLVFTGTYGEGAGARETGGVVEWRQP